jgi:hypothetical protein
MSFIIHGAFIAIAADSPEIRGVSVSRAACCNQNNERIYSGHTKSIDCIKSILFFGRGGAKRIKDDDRQWYCQH